MVYCIIIYLSFPSVINFSSEKYIGSTGHRYSYILLSFHVIADVLFETPFTDLA